MSIWKRNIVFSAKVFIWKMISSSFFRLCFPTAKMHINYIIYVCVWVMSIYSLTMGLRITFPNDNLISVCIVKFHLIIKRIPEHKNTVTSFSFSRNNNKYTFKHLITYSKKFLINRLSVLNNIENKERLDWCPKYSDLTNSFPFWKS